MSATYTDTPRLCSEFLKTDLPQDFEGCLKKLKAFTEANFTALYMTGNPFTTTLDKAGSEQLAFFIKDYAAFSVESIHMILDALLRNHDWAGFRDELEQNLTEERGEGTMGIPHLEIMRQGYRKDLGLDIDADEPSALTQAFIKQMRKVFRSDDNAFSAGAIMALEGVAIPEFHILDKIVRRYFELNKKQSSSKLNNTLTQYYIDGHKDFEIGHEAHLIESISPYINAGNVERMARGYLTVVITMSIWWEQMYLESLLKQTRDNLYNFNAEQFEVDRVIFPASA